MRKVNWNDPAAVRAYHTEYRNKKRVRINELRKSREEARRKRVLRSYGGYCACCAEDDMRFLSIDHIKGDGAERRRDVPGEKHIYKVIDSGKVDRNNYQVLCFNCNFAKGIYGVCPHTI